jgi:DHA1 family multidrug resistance protein-like MFS transporter
LTDIQRPSAPVPESSRTTRWRRNQLAIAIAASMIFLGFTLVTPFLPFYIKSLGVERPAQVALWSGLLLSVTPLLAAVLGPFWGRLADRVGMKIMVQRVLLTVTLHWGLMFFTTNVWQVLGLRILLGIFSGFGTMSVALVTQGCPRDRIGRAVGLLQATQILSMAVGPFLGGFLAATIGIRNSFLVTCALCAAALLLVVLVYRDTGAAAPAGTPVVVTPAGPAGEGVRAVVPRPAPAPAAARRSMRQILALPRLVSLMPLLFLTNMVERSLFLVVPLFVSSLATRGTAVEATTGAILSAGSFASAASAFVFGRGHRRVAPMHLLVWALAGGALFIVAMGFSDSLVLFGALRVLLGLAIGGAATLLYTVAGEVIPDTVRASAYAMLSSAAMLGGALGPSLCGVLSAWDPHAPLFAGGLIYLALTLKVASLARRRDMAPVVSLAHPSGEQP